jgi:serine/threonine protein kinase
VYALQIFLVMEYMPGGDLGKHIQEDRSVPRKTSWHQQGKYIALGIARGLVYLHSKGVVWRDCKPGNVLLDHTGTVAKIADFGLARILETTSSIGDEVSQRPYPQTQ